MPPDGGSDEDTHRAGEAIVCASFLLGSEFEARTVTRWPIKEGHGLLALGCRRHLEAEGNCPGP